LPQDEHAAAAAAYSTDYQQLLLIVRLVCGLLAAAIFVFLSVTKARCFATALDAKDIARLRPLGLRIRPS